MKCASAIGNDKPLQRRPEKSTVEGSAFTHEQDESANHVTDNTNSPIVSSPTGSLDHSAGAALAESIDEHITRNVNNHIIDLREVDQVDARTVRTMIKIQRKIRQVGGSLRLVIENSKALRYVKLTALRRVFGVYATPAAALADYESDPRNAAPVVPKQEG